MTLQPNGIGVGSLTIISIGLFRNTWYLLFAPDINNEGKLCLFMNMFANLVNKLLKHSALSARQINQSPARAAEKQMPAGKFRW